MGDAYPDLFKQQERIEQVLRQEEERFIETLEHGMRILDAALVQLKSGDTLDGQTLFTLYDTYGFPVDLTADICREREVQVDFAGFDEAMQQQRERARAAGRFQAAQGLSYDGVHTTFKGYEHLAVDDTVVQAIYLDGTSVEAIEAGQEAVVVLDVTPFYAEAGRQVGDVGVLRDDRSVFVVADTQNISSQVIGHHGTLQQGALKVGDRLSAQVDYLHREPTIRNHSATPLMHKALKEVLGEHGQQRGSLVNAETTRLDFVHDAPLTAEQIAAIENFVNNEILANEPVQAQLMSFDEAVASGAVALFGEKYDSEVRVLDIGTSRELCGGTHVRATGDIGVFKIVSEGGVAAGIRRVEALTGMNAVHSAQQTEQPLYAPSNQLESTPEPIAQRIRPLPSQVRAPNH